VCQTEIYKLDAANIMLIFKEKVFGLEISMANVVRMTVCNSAKNLTHNLGCISFSDIPFFHDVMK
jgi:hypothetical protein